MRRFKVFISSVQKEFSEERKFLADYIRNQPFDIANDFKVTIWRPTQGSQSKKATTKTREKTREILLQAVKENPSITISQLAVQLSKTPKGIEWQISKLKKEGLLARVGSDNGGHWEVKE
ncbi:MAG: winged helix-turn-helix transcriptional regulator [Candidatus Saccharibacteria bacterium]|nr:winged helix-turn-helix transcriptional regulator [Candidatus Saccharibacteria bacterium]